jgi:hypothetical protein
MHSSETSPVDDVSATMVVDHLVIRDRKSGEIIVNRRGGIAERVISETHLDADDNNTED